MSAQVKKKNQNKIESPIWLTKTQSEKKKEHENNGGGGGGDIATWLRDTVGQILVPKWNERNSFIAMNVSKETATINDSFE